MRSNWLFHCTTRCSLSSSMKPLSMDSSAWSSVALDRAMAMRAWESRSR